MTPEYLMRITDDDGNVYWMDGHSRQEAHDSFGEFVKIELLVFELLEDVTEKKQNDE